MTNTVSKIHDPIKQSTIVDYQQPAFDKLLRIGRAATTASSRAIPIKQRSNTLIVGPSGSGKSHLAEIVSRELGADFLALTAHEWIILGASARGAEVTWRHIARFLLETLPSQHAENGKSKFKVIFVDEIDKLTGVGDWSGYLRSECFALLDKKLPSGLQDEYGEQYSAKDRACIQETLSNRTLLLAAGAFQHLWEARSKPLVGFGDNALKASSIDTSQLVITLPRELVNRFRADIVILPQPMRADYQDMLLRSALLLPEGMQDGFLKLGESRIDRALECQSGFRFVEELLLDFLIQWEDSQPKLEWKEIKTDVPNVRLQLCERFGDRHFDNLAKNSE